MKDSGQEYSDKYLNILVPFISAIECGSFILIVTPWITVESGDMKSCMAKHLKDVGFSDSPLVELPLFKQIKAKNLLKVWHDDSATDQWVTCYYIMEMTLTQ